MAAAAGAGGGGDSGEEGRAPRLPPRSVPPPPLHTVEMHTGGEPLRVVPRLEAAEAAVAAAGLSLLELRRHMAAAQDHVRRALMHEPRGHRGMYGALVVRGGAAVGDADLAALFLHGAGYSAMCGHAVLALGRFALDYGLVAAPRRPETAVRLRCPCGVVTAFVPWDGHRSGNPVRFHSVPAFAAATGGARDGGVGVWGAGGAALGCWANPSPVLMSPRGGMRPPEVAYGATLGSSLSSLGKLAEHGWVPSAHEATAQHSAPFSPPSLSLHRRTHRCPRSREGGGRHRLRRHFLRLSQCRAAGPRRLLLEDQRPRQRGERGDGSGEEAGTAQRCGTALLRLLLISKCCMCSQTFSLCCFQFQLHHPESEDLAFLYGTILTDGRDAFSEEPTTNICVFADEQVQERAVLRCTGHRLFPFIPQTCIFCLSVCDIS